MALRDSLLSTTTLSGIVGGMMLTVASASAADMYTKVPYIDVPLPAVDGVNWKFDGLGGSSSNRTMYGGRGSFTVPLSTQWGLQVDGAAGSFDRRFFGAVSGHLFWRNPAQGLVGLYVNHTHWDQFGGIHVTQAGGESEVYLGRWTIQGVAGIETGNRGTNVSSVTFGPQCPGGDQCFITETTSTFDIRTQFFDKINVAYYLTDDFKGFVGHRFLGGKNAAAAGAEYGMALGGGKMAALFVEGRYGEDKSRGVWGGLRFYLGQKDKTLIKRHREDDPLDWMPDSLLSITNQLNSAARTWCVNGELILVGGVCK